MDIRKHQWIFYLIAATILATIAVQFYWNYKNFEENKQRITNEIQLSLDNAVEEYFAKLAKENFTTIFSLNGIKPDSFTEECHFDCIIKESLVLEGANTLVAKDFVKKRTFETKNISFSSDEKINHQKADVILLNMDKHLAKKASLKYAKHDIASKLIYYREKKSADSLRLTKNLRPIIMSISSNKINYHQLDSLIESQLSQKRIHIKTSFHHLKNDSLFHQTKDSVLNANSYSLRSKSTYLKDNEAFKLVYNKPNLEALKRSSAGLILSLILSLLIISCLYYLLKIIYQQKDLAVIKNDLISNITHEFKTPIATISAAIEAIENFNVLDDKEKTRKYLSMSSGQLKKLHEMVEKLLDTAALDSENLLLKKEETDLIFLINKIVSKHRLLAQKKSLQFSSNATLLFAEIDVFHFENAISNLIDNAVKYGGDKIKVSINLGINSTEILVIDNGNGIEKNQHDKIYDKFYRAPKGNTHNVKGFGIGLYYSKKIIEKHQGTINLVPNLKNTIFKITLPNG